MATPIPPVCEDLHVRAGSLNWLHARRSGIGASEIATALGIGNPRWGSPFELFRSKRGLVPDVADNADMEWGRALEATIIKRFLKCHPEFRGNACVTGKLYRSRERRWQLATPDALVYDKRTFGSARRERPPGYVLGYGCPVVVQAKTARSHDGWGEEGSDDIPVYYRAQVLQEMDVVGARIAWVPVVFGAGRDYREYRVEWNAREIQVLRIRGAEFWRRVQENDPPPVDGTVATRRALMAFNLEPEKQAQVPHALAERLARIDRLEDRVAALRARAENELREAMGDAAVALAGTRLVAKRTTYTQRRIDTTRLREDHPDLAAEYTTPREVQRLNLNLKEF